MSDPFLAEIRIAGFNFAPRGYASCDGQILPINQYQSLYALLGTTYGGDGRVTFALPDLRGRVPVHRGSTGGNSVSLGERAGSENTALNVSQIPSHSHRVVATGDQGVTGDPGGNVLASQSRRGQMMYSDPAVLHNFHPGTVGNTGNGQPHENMQPFLAINFIIALQGVFPSRN